MRACLLLFEALWLTSSVGCQQPRRAEPKPLRPAASASAALQVALAPRPAGRFLPQGGKLRQEHPRLPDTAEWRCAEHGKVVWCAGGEAAAGVVSGPPDPGYRCGPRWGTAGERVCIDEHPDYPSDGYQCAFEQELSIARVCQRAEAWQGAALPPRALPACWLDRDCPAGRCDRGACGCGADQDCQSGRCQGGACVRVLP
jgi:hypothetical protein